MPSIPTNLTRVSSGLVTGLVSSNLQSTSVQLLKLQEQLSTGQRVNRPSDDSSVVSAMTTLQRVLARIEQQSTNLSRAQATVDTTDQALGDVGEVLLEAQSIASDQVGIGSTTSTRKNQANVIDAMLTSLMTIANREVRGIHLFAGENASTLPFVDKLGGVQYVGAESDLQADLGLLTELGVNLNGVTAFGAQSSRVAGSVDLDPAATATTRISDVNGARGRGVTLGTISLDVDGTDVEVDLASADTLGDVTARIKNAINAIDPTAGNLAIAPDGFALTANLGHSIAISDIGTGVIAADLGIDVGATDATVNGTDIDPRLTERTTLASFAGAPDLASGLKITHGARTEVVDFSAATNVRDMINLINKADVGVKLSINADGTGLNLVSNVSGTQLSIGENAGGTTAADLGLRSMDTTTTLGTLNHGRGVDLVTGDDLRIHLHDGMDVDVDLSSAATLGDVIGLINAAGGGEVTASMAADGNGLVLADATAGADNFRAYSINNSHAAEDLGIQVNVGAGATLAGEDVAPQIRTESVFTHLMMLREGLATDDDDLITEAGSLIHADIDAVATARANMGVRSRQALQQTSRLEDRKVSTESILSDLRDADYTEVVSRFSQLQQQLQANLLSSQQMLSLSLLDFLR